MTLTIALNLGKRVFAPLLVASCLLQGRAHSFGSGGPLTAEATPREGPAVSQQQQTLPRAGRWVQRGDARRALPYVLHPLSRSPKSLTDTHTHLH